MIKAIIFDFDGVILDTETPWFEAYREVFAEEGGDLPLAEWAKGVGTSFEHNTVFDYISNQIGRRIERNAVEQRSAVRYKQLVRNMALMPGVEETLQSAKLLGVKIGLASSSTKAWVEGYLKQYGIYDRFEAISTRDDVAEVKPNPELYLRTLRLLGVSGQEAVAFEDSLNGLRAAKAAGLHCVVIPNKVTSHLPFEGESMRVSSLADIPLADLLDKIVVK